MGDETQKSKADKSSTDAGAAQVQAAMDEATAKGYLGEKTDPTPNEHYTLQGVVAEKPTPETDPEAAAAAAERSEAVGERTP